jgi:hypothetical protein
MGLCWRLTVDLKECRRDQIHLYEVPRRKGGGLIGSGTDHRSEQICDFA